METKEIGQLRRRFRPEKCAVNRIYGCFVNGSRKVISYLDESLGSMPQEEAEMYLGLLRKSMSGTIGKNLIDIVFSTQQVADSDEHRMLMALRETALQDKEIRQSFYQKVIDSLDMDGENYLLLLVYDTYDVPGRGKDGGKLDSETVFSYIVCCVCPVKEGKVELGYFPGDNEFHCAGGQVVSAPELGFIFPAFDHGSANIYNALFYSRKADALHQEFINALFHTEPPMSAAEQQEAFDSALSQALGESCSIRVAQSVHERLRECVESQKESDDLERPAVTAREVGTILRDCGASEEQVDTFREMCDERFGRDAALNPGNLINSKLFQVVTDQAVISMDPSCSYLLETRILDGRRYLLIPAEGNVTVNGLPVQFPSEDSETGKEIL